MELIQQAAQWFTSKSIPKPPPSDVVDALLLAEKNSRKSPNLYSFEQLIGTWNLCFITGTKKSRSQAGVLLGPGKYLPSWVNIQISYSKVTDEIPNPQESFSRGKVENSVKFAGLDLSLSGPVKFQSKRNILAFDFTQITVKLFSSQVYSGYIRGGKEKEDSFFQESMGKLAFFAYFLIDKNVIAARGKGGGLAIWSK